jgi:hypothetical protein
VEQREHGIERQDDGVPIVEHCTDCMPGHMMGLAVTVHQSIVVPGFLDLVYVRGWHQREGGDTDSHQRGNNPG